MSWRRPRPLRDLPGPRAPHLARGLPLDVPAGDPLADLALLGLLGWLLRVRQPHPPTLDDASPLPRGRVALALAALLVFAVSFTPEPVITDWADLFR